MIPRLPLTLRWWQTCLVVLGVWSVIGLLFATHEAAVYARLGRQVPWTHIAMAHVVEWWSWALMTPLVYVFVGRAPLGTTGYLRAVVLYAAAAVVCLVVNVALIAGGLLMLPWHGKPFGATYLEHLGRLFAYDIFLFVWVALGLHALVYYGAARDRELEATRLQGQLASARLDMLTMQLQPHFLFNTLNTISGLVSIEPRRADRMISRLADLLRVSLRQDRGSLVALRDELVMLDTYLEIQLTRFDDRLVVERHIESGLEAALVPTFLLQPIVENTIRHAVAPYSAPVRLEIGARRIGDRLCLLVRDDGPGLPGNDGATIREGVGLGNTRQRLEELYGAEHRFTIGTGDDGGVEVAIELPLRTALPDGPSLPCGGTPG